MILSPESAFSVHLDVSVTIVSEATFPDPALKTRKGYTQKCSDAGLEQPSPFDFRG